MRKLKLRELGVLTTAPELNRVVVVAEVSRDFERFPNIPIREFPVYLVRAADENALKLRSGKFVEYFYVSGSGIAPVGKVDFDSSPTTVINWSECVWIPEEMETRENEN